MSDFLVSFWNSTMAIWTKAIGEISKLLPFSKLYLFRISLKVLIRTKCFWAFVQGVDSCWQISKYSWLLSPLDIGKKIVKSGEIPIYRIKLFKTSSNKRIESLMIKKTARCRKFEQWWQKTSRTKHSKVRTLNEKLCQR